MQAAEELNKTAAWVYTTYKYLLVQAITIRNIFCILMYTPIKYLLLQANTELPRLPVQVYTTIKYLLVQAEKDCFLYFDRYILPVNTC